MPHVMANVMPVHPSQSLPISESTHLRVGRVGPFVGACNRPQTADRRPQTHAQTHDAAARALSLTLVFSRACSLSISLSSVARPLFASLSCSLSLSLALACSCMLGTLYCLVRPLYLAPLSCSRSLSLFLSLPVSCLLCSFAIFSSSLFALPAASCRRGLSAACAVWTVVDISHLPSPISAWGFSC